MGRVIRALWHRADWLASALRKAKIKLRFGDAVRFGRGVWVGAGARIDVQDGGRVVIGANTLISDQVWLSAQGGSIGIGAESLVGRGSVIISTQRITIGQDALIAEYVSIRDHDHAHAPGVAFNLQGRLEAPVEIGTNVWLAAKVTVTRGVRISSDTVVGANAVVTKSIDTPGRHAGVPARPIPMR